MSEAEPSSTEPSPYGGDVPEFYHLQMHSLRFPALLVRRDAAASNGGFFGGVPASDEAIAALPAETTAGEGETRGKECAVCLEAYEAGDTLRTMPCAHGFHESCIFEWLRVSRLCPLCRFALPAAVETESPFMGDDDGGGGDREEEPGASDS
ncbi:E3 ubiquitin-protein ligase RING1-like [Panicum hallii]|uniref:E3 ubiquitin-protein ligase RING1-like n=1 Tax=Panicum hallii TaxID=206008 RepID=UPI000DF4F0BC|nr:E3 ubiquitin-protein ligase RING1-like [Panicum hallii]